MSVYVTIVEKRDISNFSATRKSEDYFKDPKNAHKIPSWWRKGVKVKKKDDGSEDGAVIHCQSVEMILAAPEITSSAALKLLEDPNVWVVDTSASCDSTCSHEGMNNRQIPSLLDGVTLPDGNKKGTIMI
eukprot:10185170-Ditylum_brightwellii.AAC.1